MPSHFDRLETRSPDKREAEDFRILRALLTESIGKAPALKKQLKGIDIRAEEPCRAGRRAGFPQE